MDTVLNIVNARRVLVGATAVMVAAAAFAFAPMLGGGTTTPASAHVDPVGCNAAFGGAAGTINVDPVPVDIVDGTVLPYVVGVQYPAPPVGTACTLFNIDVFIDVPPADNNFQFVCNIAVLSSPGMALCPGTVDYVADGDDREAGLLVATARSLGNKHDRTDDCIFANRTPTSNSPCSTTQVISVLQMSDTPTPTVTNTNTPTATNTPTPTNTPEDDDTPTRTRTPDDDDDRPTRTRTSVPPTSTPTRVSTTLPQVATPRPPVGVALPQTGSGSDGDGGVSIVALALMGAAGVVALGAGMRLRSSRVR